MRPTHKYTLSIYSKFQKPKTQKREEDIDISTMYFACQVNLFLRVYEVWRAQLEDAK